MKKSAKARHQLLPEANDIRKTNKRTSRLLSSCTYAQKYNFIRCALAQVPAYASLYELH